MVSHQRPETTRSDIRLRRRLTASPHCVYRAWLEPESVKKWMAPGTSEVVRVEIEERIGGVFRTWKAEAGTVTGGFDSEIVELVADQHLRFRWGFIGPQRRDGPSFDTQLDVRLMETPNGQTDLELQHAGLEELERAMPEVAHRVEDGWNATLDNLQGLVQS